MIVLDTNVVSELMRPAPDSGVRDWVDARPANDLYLTSMTVAELLSGIARLSPGRRRERLSEHVGRLVDEVFADRVLAFDAPAAVAYARIATGRERAGRPISTADGIVAATAAAAGANSLATRNIVDFVGAGLTLVDPWNA